MQGTHLREVELLSHNMPYRRRVDAILEDYLAMRSDHEELIAALIHVREDARSDATGDHIGQLDELVNRVEMIQFNVCAAQRRDALTKVIDGFLGGH